MEIRELKWSNSKDLHLILLTKHAFILCPPESPTTYFTLIMNLPIPVASVGSQLSVVFGTLAVELSVAPVSVVDHSSVSTVTEFGAGTSFCSSTSSTTVRLSMATASTSPAWLSNSTTDCCFADVSSCVFISLFLFPSSVNQNKNY